MAILRTNGWCAKIMMMMWTLSTFCGLIPMSMAFTPSRIIVASHQRQSAFSATASVPRVSGSSRSSSSSSSTTPIHHAHIKQTILQAVVDIKSEEAFDATVKNAGNSLVVVDYSTTWCGPCKVIAPKFEEFSLKYPNAVFLKVIGDSSPEASKLMKREGVRSVPSFHYFVNGEKVDVVNGANAEAIEAAINNHIKAAA